MATLGGARPKALIFDQDKLSLAKFPAKCDGFDVPVVERACLELARQRGLPLRFWDALALPMKKPPCSASKKHRRNGRFVEFKNALSGACAHDVALLVRAGIGLALLTGGRCTL